MKANTKKIIANTVKLAVTALLAVIPNVLRKKPQKGG